MGNAKLSSANLGFKAQPSSWNLEIKRGCGWDLWLHSDANPWIKESPQPHSRRGFQPGTLGPLLAAAPTSAPFLSNPDKGTGMERGERLGWDNLVIGK